MNTPQNTEKSILQRIIVPLFTFLLAITLLYFAFRGVNWRSLLQILSNSNLPLIGLSFLIMLIVYIIRAFRWRVLLLAKLSITIKSVFRANNIGYLGNAVLPARAGEVLRTLAVKRETNADMVFILTTVFGERVFDAAFLAIVALVTISQLPNTPPWLNNAAIIILTVIALFLLFSMYLSRLQKQVHWFIDLLPVSIKWNDRLKSALASLLETLNLLYQPIRAINFSILTVVIWSFDVLFTMLIGQALGISLTIPMIILLLAALGLSSAAPSTPGYIGIYQFVSVSVLVPFGVSQDEALALIIAVQGVSYLFWIIWGIESMLYYNFTNQPEK